MYYPLAAPVRLLDTRGIGVSPNACSVNNTQPITGGTSILQIARGGCNGIIPANAVVITGNITPVPSGVGFLTLWPSDAAQPTTATTNYVAGEIVNNVFTVGLGAADGAFKIFSWATSHVVVDVTGYYAPPDSGGVYFHPLPKPVRLLETRSGQPGCYNTGGQLATGAIRTQQAKGACDGVTIPAVAQSIVGNATVINPATGGYITLWPANATTQPLVSSGNFTTGATVNSPFTVALSSAGEFKIYTTAATDLTVDVLGYYSPEANDVNGAGLLFNPLAHPVRLLETRPNLPVGCYKPSAPITPPQEYTQPARGLCDGLTITNDALAIVGNATVVNDPVAGDLALWKSSITKPLPTVSHYTAWQIHNRHVTVALGASDGAFKIYASTTTDLVIDVVGFFAPAPTVTLTRTPANLQEGELATVTWSVTAGTTSADDWIGLFPVGAPNNAFVQWGSTSGASNGSLQFPVPYGSGTYEFRYLLNNGYHSVATSASLGVFAVNYALERLDPINRIGEPGEDLLSGNFNWHLPLVNLPGRGGLDLNLGLTYNSLVWTKANTFIGYDADMGFPSPGFRLGFPVIESSYYRTDTQVSVPYFLLILPSGRRVELRNNMAGVGGSATNIYESVDSSRLRLKVDTSNSQFIQMTLYAPDGTRMLFQPTDQAWQCTKITDRNGNYITATYNAANQVAPGKIRTVTDTLGRVINFKYDFPNNHLKKIYRCINNGTCNDSNPSEVAYTWAMFEWSNVIFNVNSNTFQNLATTGPHVNQEMISRVILPDGTDYRFSYSRLGQIYQIEHRGGSGLSLNTLKYNLPFSPTGLTDCPRFTERKDFVHNWLNPIRTYAFKQTDPLGVYGQVVFPDGTAVRESYAMDSWRRGLLLKSVVKETDNGPEKKKTELTWTQDNPDLPLPLNPRVTTTMVSDDASNCRKTTTSYTSTATPQPEYIREYSGCGSTVYRTTKLSYFTTNPAAGNAPYVQLNPDNTPDRWIIGLVGERTLHTGDLGAIKAKVKYYYDEPGTGGEQLVHQSPVINHESTANSNPLFNQNYLMRGNLTSLQRWDADDPMNASKAVVTKLGYNTSGSVIFQRDPAGAQTDISYADDFADGLNRNTWAYPTKVIDPDGRLASPQFFSKTKYGYSLGQVTQAASPKRPGDSNPSTVNYEYDSIGRLLTVKNLLTGDVKLREYEYDLDNLERVTKATLEAGQGTFFSAEHLDGHGRVWAVERDHPGSTGGLSLQYTFYDSMGRPYEQSNPTEVNAAWGYTGDDQNNGFIYTTQTYDWQGRPWVTTNQDTTTRQLLYSGCGCAGGQTVTAIDEVGRTSDVSYDLFGRPWRERTYQGSNVYATKINSYNVRDQLAEVKSYSGEATGSETCSPVTCQKTSLEYDGHGRLWKRRQPIETGDTSFTYNNDDSLLTVTDARGATATYGYNHRGLVTSINYSSTVNCATQPTNPNCASTTQAVSFAYDELGNRSSMNDGLGNLVYTHDALGRLQAETRTFNGVGSFQLSYEYNLAGQLKKITDPWGGIVNYSFNNAGLLTGVTGQNYNGTNSNQQLASQVAYRAWGGLKNMLYGNGYNLGIEYTSRLLPSSYNLPGVIRKTYEYYPDGRLRYSQDLNDHRYSRSAQYDHVGRLSLALSGSQASGGSQMDGLYRQEYTYNAWGNPTNRVAYHWDQNQSYGAPVNFENNRLPWATYSAAGQITHDGRSYTYDANGQMTLLGGEITYAYDGDGRLAKSSNLKNIYPPVYHLRSSVLGGAVVSEMSPHPSNPNGRRDLIYANGELLAIHGVSRTTSGVDSHSVGLQHSDAMAMSQRATNLSNLGGGPNTELDPFGADMSLNNPYTQPPPELPDETDPTFPETGNPQRFLGMGCNWNGLPVDCPYLMDQISKRAESLPTYRVDVGAVWRTVSLATVTTMDGPDSDGTIRIGSVMTVPFGYWQIGSRVSFAGFTNVAGSGQPSPQGGGQQGQQQLSPCLRDALRQYFPSQTVHGKSYSPIDDARFTSGIPEWAKLGGQLPGTVEPAAITLGLYDIHYNSQQVSITGGEKFSLITIIEEVAHTAQFLQLWAGMRASTAPKSLPRKPSYGEAKIKWKLHYAYYGVKGLGYDNEVEKQAKDRVEYIMGELTLKDSTNIGKICGFDLYR